MKEKVKTTIEVTRAPEKTLIFRFHLGEGEVDGEKFTFAYSGSGINFYFSKEQRYYTVSFRSIGDAVMRARRKLLKEVHSGQPD